MPLSTSPPIVTAPAENDKQNDDDNDECCGIHENFRRLVC